MGSQPLKIGQTSNPPSQTEPADEPIPLTTSKLSRCKRLLDVSVALLLLILLLPALIAISLLVKWEDGGPIFFKQPRIGLGGDEFLCGKFRTMVEDAEFRLAHWEHNDPRLLAQYRANNFKLPDDPRITRIGRWLRRTSLDELPQLFNVLKGEMSLVGPRPLLRRELQDYGHMAALYIRVRPGLTGLWQINGRSRTTFAERIAFDARYIRNWTFLRDIVILYRTIGVLLRQEGAY
jgi:lipopolysaccharide/colanic/teichoic acid biosynthesis glycosyltransferase